MLYKHTLICSSPLREPPDKIWERCPKPDCLQSPEVQTRVKGDHESDPARSGQRSRTSSRPAWWGDGKRSLDTFAGECTEGRSFSGRAVEGQRAQDAVRPQQQEEGEETQEAARPQPSSFFQRRRGFNLMEFDIPGRKGHRGSGAVEAGYEGSSRCLLGKNGSSDVSSGGSLRDGSYHPLQVYSDSASGKGQDRRLCPVWLFRDFEVDVGEPSEAGSPPHGSHDGLNGAVSD